MWSNTACLKLVAQPTLALAAKYCAVKTAAKTDCSHEDQHQEHLYDVAVVIVCNTNINDLGDNHRNQKVKYDFQQFE